MAATSSKDIQAPKVSLDLLKCPLCTTQLVNPHILNCQHTFCFRCLKGSMKKSKGPNTILQCTVCRKKTILGKEGIKGIPKNFSITGILRMIKKASSNTTTTSEESKDSSSSQSISDVTTKICDAGKKQRPIPDALISKKSNTSITSTDKNKNRKIKKRFLLTKDHEKEHMQVDRNENTSIIDWVLSNDDEMCPCGCGGYGFVYFSDNDHYDSSSISSHDSCDGYSKDESRKLPALKSFRGIRLNMKVYVFGQKGTPHKGTVHVLEKIELTTGNCSKVYAGVALERENGSLVTRDLNEIKHSFLYEWLMATTYPCAVVSIDQCCPRKKLEVLLEKCDT